MPKQIFMILGTKFWNHDAGIFYLDPREKEIVAIQLERVTRIKHDGGLIIPILDWLRDSKYSYILEKTNYILHTFTPFPYEKDKDVINIAVSQFKKHIGGLVLRKYGIRPALFKIWKVTHESKFSQKFLKLLRNKNELFYLLLPLIREVGLTNLIKASIELWKINSMTREQMLEYAINNIMELVSNT